MNPTAAELARLNPTAVNIKSPTGQGLFRATGDYGSEIFKRNTDGSISIFNVSNVGRKQIIGDSKPDQYGNYSVLQGQNGGSLASAGLDYLKQNFGIDYNSLPEFNMGDGAQRLASKSQFTGDMGSFFSNPQRPGTETSTINGTPNVLGSQANIRSVNPGETPLPTLAGTNPLAAGTNPGALNTPQGGSILTADQLNAIAKQSGYKGGTFSSVGLGNPVNGSTIKTGATYQAPPANTTATDVNNSTYAGMQASIASMRAANQSMVDQRNAETQTQRDALQKSMDELTTLQQENLIGQDNAILATKQKALAALDEGNAVFRKAQGEYTALSDQMQGLLTQGQDLIKQQKATTGLASIMNPRINQTISDVTAQAGVLQAVLTAKYNGMGAAYGVLDATVKAVNLYKQDEINYYKSVNDFYEGQKDTKTNALVQLTADQKKYLDYKINALDAEIKTAETNAQKLKELFTDPDTALKFAKAGITINTPQDQWGAKLAVQDKADTTTAYNQKMILDGYSASPVANGVTYKDADGKTWYKTAAKSTDSDGMSVSERRAQNESLSNYIGQVSTYQTREEALNELNKYSTKILVDVGANGLAVIKAEIDRIFPPPVEKSSTKTFLDRTSVPDTGLIGYKAVPTSVNADRVMELRLGGKVEKTDVSPSTINSFWGNLFVQ